MTSGTREGGVARRTGHARYAFLGIAVCLLAACASKPTRAPVIDGQAHARYVTKPKNPPAKEKEPDWRPAVYVVKKGDTLYSIALDHGLYYRDLAQWNALADPNIILVDQVLRLTEPKETEKPAVAAPPVISAPLLRGPKVVKLPYADNALARLKVLAEPPESALEAKVVNRPAVKAETRPLAKAGESEPVVRNTDADKGKVASNKVTSTSTSIDDDDDDVETWQWPTDGRLLQGFGDGGSKGIDVTGKRGQPVHAAAAGKVVYSGTGLRGYGRLLIIKHNKTYLSAYAHNHQLLVKEGEVVKKGDKIAEMGDSDTSQVKLHFEIRRFGKPVDPLKFLPADKS